MKTPPHRIALAAALAALLCAACRTPPAAAPVPPAAPAAARDAIPQEEMPDPLLYLPPPPAPDSPAKAWDLARYEWGKTVRTADPARAAQAVQDALFTWENLYAMFARSYGRTISEAETPALCAMLRYGLESVRHACRGAKRKYMRVRPFAELHEPSLTPDDERFLVNNGSYPSGHAANGWAAALLLAEVAPGSSEAILERGLAIGESRVIVGVHWQSDVDAARVVAAAAVARLHADPEFLARMAAAKAEAAARR